jgi:hypothetical protein
MNHRDRNGCRISCNKEAAPSPDYKSTMDIQANQSSLGGHMCSSCGPKPYRTDRFVKGSGTIIPECRQHVHDSSGCKHAQGNSHGLLVQRHHHAGSQHSQQIHESIVLLDSCGELLQQTIDEAGAVSLQSYWLGTCIRVLEKCFYVREFAAVRRCFIRHEVGSHVNSLWQLAC